MSKVAPKISSPGPAKMPNTGGHTDGIAKGGHAHGGALAKISVPAGSASGGIPNPVQKPNSNLRGKNVGQPNPDTGAAATKKPKTKAALAFYGER